MCSAYDTIYKVNLSVYIPYILNRRDTQMLPLNFTTCFIQAISHFI